MTTEDALPVVAWRCKHPSHPGMIGHYPWGYQEHQPKTAHADADLDALVRQSDALAALTLVQAERDAMQQERDELRTALESCCVHMERVRDILTDGNPRPDCNWGMLDTSNARAALTPKATQPTSEASRGR